LALLKREIQIDEASHSAAVGLPQDDGDYHNKPMASRTRSTALALSALTAIDPDPELASYLVRHLMNARGQHGFGTTNATAFAILALADHLAAQQPVDTTSNYALGVKEAVLACGTLTRVNPADTITLTLTHSGAGQMYVTIRRRMVLARERIAASGPVSITREIARVDGAPLGALRRGDVVQVTLRVKLDAQGSFIMIQDNLPAGFEAINEGLNTSSRMPQDDQGEDIWWQ
jgi:uncharacterized protein YfaS (alpha-2-macroglobulin family)